MVDALADKISYVPLVSYSTEVVVVSTNCSNSVEATRREFLGHVLASIGRQVEKEDCYDEIVERRHRWICDGTCWRVFPEVKSEEGL